MPPGIAKLFHLQIGFHRHDNIFKMTVGNSSIVHETLASLDISDSSTIARLVDVLDEHSKSLAVDEQLRCALLPLVT